MENTNQLNDQRLIFKIGLREDLQTDFPTLPHVLHSSGNYAHTLSSHISQVVLEDPDIVLHDPAPHPLLWPKEFRPEVGTFIISFSKYLDIDVRGQPGKQEVGHSAMGCLARA